MIATIFLIAAAEMTFTADKVAADNVTKAVAATGHVHAVSGVMSLRSDYLYKDAEGRIMFSYPTTATTCTNDTCLAEWRITHWRITGALEYKANDYVILKDAWLRFYEIPCFYLPYLYYPLDTDCGFSWMPGYVGSWGAFVLTKYRYHLLGDVTHQDNTWWLRGDTRFDLRYNQGIAIGEDLFWNLGDFGTGSFQLYYAWDQYTADKYGTGGSSWNSANWGSQVERDRYGMGIKHRWEATERDTVRIRGGYYSDSYFRSDFYRKSFFDLKTQYLSYDNSGVFWEHLENLWSFGVEASGRLNKFYSMTERLPEIYLNLNPLPIFGTMFNYETENKIGYLQRRPAVYGNADPSNVYSYQPGRWADYNAFRFDTYHRITAPFKTCGDVLSVVPRLGYHGTYWNESGYDTLNGKALAGEAGNIMRSIGEAGVTFAGRGVAMVDDSWRHMIEPYMDTLVQEAWYSGLGNGTRPYVFDAIDESMTWEDQFAGRARNLPYSYYGITPGVRNAWDLTDEKGNRHQIIDFDMYVAAQFNTTTHLGTEENHQLTEVGKPHYGINGSEFVPGARLRWTPDRDISLGVCGEYDSDNNRIAYGQVRWSHKICEDFSYNANYTLRDHRYWDFASRPYDSNQMSSDEGDLVKFHMVTAGFTYQPLDWLAFGPHLRWDLRDNELDTVGTWIDYLTDCLGFRLILEYQNEFETIDGYRWEDEFSIGFYIYLRAFGAESGSVFLGQ